MFVEEVVNNLYIFLTIDPSLHPNISLIRLHTKKLHNLGEFSFPLDITNWKHVLSSQHPKNCTLQTFVGTILKYLEQNGNDTSLQSLCSSNLSIYKTDIIKSNVHLFLNRLVCYKHGIKETMDQKESFGSWKMNLTINLLADVSTEENVSDLDISDLRVIKLHEVARNLLLFNSCTISDNHTDSTVLFSRQSTNTSKDKVLIHCAPVLITSYSNDECQIPKASDFYKQRTIDMRLMAEHKYGVRISSEQRWRDFFEKLGGAAVMIELMENKPSHSLKLNLNNPTLCSQKNASFIMYNCARLAAIFKELDNRTVSGKYPKLPEFDHIEFELLKEHEEWELLFVFVLQFPLVVKNTIRDFHKGNFSPHFITAFLSGLVSTFSVYYRRVKILCEPRLHLIPRMFARIYLLKAVQRVLHNGLNLLNIEPVSQM